MGPPVAAEDLDERAEGQGTVMRPKAGIAVIGLTRSMRRTAMRSAVVVAVVLGLSSGCATIRRHNTLGTEQMLSAAGFHMKLANTPEKLAHVQTALQSIERRRKGSVSWHLVPRRPGADAFQTIDIVFAIDRHAGPLEKEPSQPGHVSVALTPLHLCQVFVMAAACPVP